MFEATILKVKEIKLFFLGGINMSKSQVEQVDMHSKDVESLKGTLFSTIVFVGGVIVAFIVILFFFYMTRL